MQGSGGWEDLTGREGSRLVLRRRRRPAAALEKPRGLRSEAVGTGGGRRHALSMPHLPLSLWAFRIVPGCGVVVSFPFFHLVIITATVCVPRTAWPLSPHCVIPSSCPAGGGRRAGVSFQRSGCCLWEAPARQDPEGVSPLGRGTFLHPAGPLNPSGLPADAPGFPISCEPFPGQPACPPKPPAAIRSHAWPPQAPSLLYAYLLF